MNARSMHDDRPFAQLCNPRLPVDSDRLRFALGAVEGGQEAASCKLPTTTYAELVAAIYELLDGVRMRK